MRYLFIHQNFPGQFLHLVRHLTRQGDNEVVFISEPNSNVLPGVRRIFYKMKRGAAAETHPAAQEFDVAMLRAEMVAQTARNLKALGFEPDIIIGHHGWGELLNIRDIYPDTPLLGYLEFYYHVDRFDVGFDPEFPNDPALHARVRAKNAVNLLALNNTGQGQTPTLFQKSTYPDWAQDRISVLREGVDLQACAPDASLAKKNFLLRNVLVRPDERLVTYVSRDLEPYRGFHSVMRALPAILDERPDARVIIVGGDGVSYGARLSQGCWREILTAELGSRLDLSRVHFVGKLDYQSYADLLKRSDAHLYLTYPFVASWSLREAIASGCAIVGSDTGPVQEFIRHGRNGLLVPFHDPAAIADAVLELLEDRALSQRLRRAARKDAERTLSMADYLSSYESLIARTIAARGTPFDEEASPMPAGAPRGARPVRAARMIA